MDFSSFEPGWLNFIFHALMSASEQLLSREEAESCSRIVWLLAASCKYFSGRIRLQQIVFKTEKRTSDRTRNWWCQLQYRLPESMEFGIQNDSFTPPICTGTHVYTQRRTGRPEVIIMMYNLQTTKTDTTFNVVLEEHFSFYADVCGMNIHFTAK